MGAVGWAGHGEEIVFRHPGCWGSDLGWGSWEDWTLMLWRLRGDFRFRREKICLAFWPILPPHTTVFSLGVRTTLPTTTAGTVIHPRAGENTQILGTCSAGSLTAQEKKEPEEFVAVGEEPRHYFGEIPCLGSWGQKVLMPRIQVSLVPMVQILRFSHLSVDPHH